MNLTEIIITARENKSYTGPCFTYKMDKDEIERLYPTKRYHTLEHQNRAYQVYDLVVAKKRSKRNAKAVKWN